MRNHTRASAPVSTRRPAGRRHGLLAAALVLALAAPAAWAQQDAIAPSALAQIGALLAEKESRTPAQRKIASGLLFEARRQRDDASLQGLPTGRSQLEYSPDGRVLVDITGEVDDALLTRIEALGGRVVNHHARWDAVRAELPLERVEALAEWPGLRNLRPADRFMTHQGTVVTEGDVAHRADVARGSSGADGTGVTACAISDSVDQLANLIASGELPAGTTVLPGQSGNPGTSEGTALLEIIHDIAPEADLIFATGAPSMAQFAQNILDLEAADCDVIVDDIGYFAEGVFQDDVVAQAVEAVTDEGVIFFSAAGNSGNKNDGTSGVYEGQFLATTVPPPIAPPPGFTAHDFTGAGPTGNSNIVSEPGFGIGNDAVIFTLQWSDPLDGSGNDYDLFLLDPALTAVVAFSTNTQDGDDDPFEAIGSTGFDDTGLRLVIVKSSGAAERFLHLNTHRGRLQTSTNGQIFGHPAAESALAVAAVNVSTAGGAGGVFDGSESVETFSSDGPRRIFFESDGTPVTGPIAPGPAGTRGTSQSSIVRDKPDVAAADGVSTTTPGFTTFFGTSASAPHAAGIAALFIDELDPLLTDELDLLMQPRIHSVAQTRWLFDSTALDIEAPGFDNDSGSGIIDTPFDTNVIFADGFESGDTAAWSSSVP